MAITSIDAISYTYDSGYQYAVFGYSISDDQIQTLMSEYNIIQTGEQYSDLKALYNAMYSSFSQSASVEARQASNQPSQQAVPYQYLMNMVGLQTTGDVQTDYNNYMNIINALKTNAKSNNDKSMISSLEMQAQSVFVPQQVAETPSVSGMDIIAQLNRAYTLGY